MADHNRTGRQLCAPRQQRRVKKSWQLAEAVLDERTSDVSGATVSMSRLITVPTPLQEKIRSPVVRCKSVLNAKVFDRRAGRLG
jgi:hypothetical protein